MRVSEKFFCLPDSMKKPFSRGSLSYNGNHGWVSLETERHVNRQTRYAITLTKDGKHFTFLIFS